MGLIPTDSTGSSQGGTHPKHLQPWLGSPTSLWGQRLCDTTPLTRLSPLQCLEELAASVEEVLEALGDRVLPALGLVLAGLWEVESRGCCGVTPKAAPTAWGEALWAPQLLVPQQVTPGALGSSRAPRDHRVLQTHRGTRSAGGRSSPGPAGGPELQPGPCAAGLGRRTPSSLWGQSRCHPLTPLSTELLPTPRHLPAPQTCPTAQAKGPGAFSTYGTLADALFCAPFPSPQRIPWHSTSLSPAPSPRAGSSSGATKLFQP